MMTVDRQVLSQSGESVVVKPLLETAWFWVGLPAILLLMILLGSCSVIVFQSEGDWNLLAYMGSLSLLPLIALVLFLLLRRDGAIADRHGLTLWNVWQPSKRQQIAWSKIYALDVRRTRELKGYATKANLEVQEGGMRLVVPCLYNVEIFRAIVSHAQLVVREMPADWQARMRRGHDPFKILNRVSKSMWTGELRCYWTRQDPAPHLHLEQATSEQYGLASEPAGERVVTRPAFKTSWSLVGLLVVIIFGILSVLCTVGIYGQHKIGWDFVVAMGLLIPLVAPILFLPLVLYGDGAVADYEGLTLTRVWQPSKHWPIAWSDIYALEITGAGGSLLSSGTELKIKLNGHRLSTRCPYDLPLLREIVSRASLVLQVAPDNWRAWAKGTDDPFVALEQRGAPRQRWYWARVDPAPGVAETAPSIRVEPEHVDFGILSSETRHADQQSVIVLNTSETDARCCIVGAPWWLQARPKIFTLAPGARQTVELEVDVDKVQDREHRITLTFALDEGWHRDVEVRLQVKRQGLLG